MNIQELAQKCYDGSAAKGWHDPDMEAKRTKEDMFMLFISEVAEATESVRNGEPYFWVDLANGTQGITKPEEIPLVPIELPGRKPEGEAVELVDCAIRIMDYFVMRDWFVDEGMDVVLPDYTTPLGAHLLIVTLITTAGENAGTEFFERAYLNSALLCIMEYFVTNNWNFEDVVLAKLAYNSTRSHRHGGKLV